MGKEELPLAAFVIPLLGLIKSGSTYKMVAKYNYKREYSEKTAGHHPIL
jgi:hypothetical protein